MYTYGRFEPTLKRISVVKLKCSTFLIKRLDFISSIAVLIQGNNNNNNNNNIFI